MNWGLLEDKRRMVFKIPVGDMSPGKAKKIMIKLRKHIDYNEILMEERKQKLDKITNKINEKRPL